MKCVCRNPRLILLLNTKLDKFPAKDRNKLRHLRYILKHSIKAKEDKKISEFIMQTYYLAAKKY